MDSYSTGSLKQQSTGRYDDGGFVLDKHAELDSYSASSLKQQSTGRYDDSRFVLDKHSELDSYSASSLKQQSTGRHYDGRFVLDNTLSWILIVLAQRSNSPHVDMMIVALY